MLRPIFMTYYPQEARIYRYTQPLKSLSGMYMSLNKRLVLPYRPFNIYCSMNICMEKAIASCRATRSITHIRTEEEWGASYIQ